MHYTWLILLLLTLNCAYAQTVNDTTNKVLWENWRQLQQQTSDEIGLIALDDAELADENFNAYASLLNAGKDVLYNAAAFNWNIARFSMRGYSKNLFSTYFNGVPLDNLINGGNLVNLWNGLTDVFKNRELVLGLQQNNFSFGNLGTVVNIVVKPNTQSKQNIINVAFSNRAYANRNALTHYTGKLNNGWAFVYSAAWQWANENYVPGTGMKNFASFFSAEKSLNNKHFFTFNFLGNYNSNNMAAPATEELMLLSNSRYYNANWGYQNGKKRNAVVRRTIQPIALMNYHWQMDALSSFKIGLLAGISLQKQSGFDWNNVPDPRPDYYKYLPSFQADSVLRNAIQNYLIKHPDALQINWSNLYTVNSNNKETIFNVNGNTNESFTGLRSRYILRDNHINTIHFAASTIYQKVFTNNWQLNIGAQIQYQQSHYFQSVNDLLGGDFWVNWNQFAIATNNNNSNSIQYNLLQPNQLIKEGGKYGYDFDASVFKLSRFLQVVKQFKKVDINIAECIGYTQLQRNGRVQNGLFPDNSFGMSKQLTFLNYGMKLGVTYKQNGKNYFNLNLLQQSLPPNFFDVFISPKFNSFMQEDIRSVQYKSAEFNYYKNTNTLKLRITGFYTAINNLSKIYTYYDDDIFSFINNELTNIAQRHMGIEFGAEWRYNDKWQFSTAFVLGDYSYTNRAKATLRVENTAAIIQKDIVYWKNFKVPGSPQKAANFSITYRPLRNAYMSVSTNYLSDNWMQLNPIRRTSRAVQGLDAKSIAFANVIQPGELPKYLFVNLFAAFQLNVPKSNIIKLKPIWISTGVTNLLNNQQMFSSAYEQMRFDFASQDISKFAPKYFSAYGTQFFISTSIKF
ncbi:TonB-dependent receptor [Hydrotalea sandarakina]|jgi:hypothetical protein|uniref:TonB-dependent receptor n=1 Tax=Hydrotalea sandarakina TaxID=1004304 RepID=A0A2W7RT63_9BACT|nr:hypothetical protein [Hydrotalea sandarakina]PZX63651.1 hypothetical protein LX80_01302 [Hydrotalea sandarakina]